MSQSVKDALADVETLRNIASTQDGRSSLRRVFAMWTNVADATAEADRAARAFTYRAHAAFLAVPGLRGE